MLTRCESSFGDSSESFFHYYVTGFVEWPDRHRGQAHRINMLARNARNIFNRHCANEFRVALEIVEAQTVNLGVDQKVRDLRVLLKTKHEAASQIQLCDFKLLGCNRLVDDALDLRTQPCDRPAKIRRRGADESYEAAGVQSRTRSDRAECAVCEPLFVAQHSRNSRGKPWTRSKYRVHHQQGIEIGIAALDADVPDEYVYLFLRHSDESRDWRRLPLGLDDGWTLELGAFPASKQARDSGFELAFVDIANYRDYRVVGNVKAPVEPFNVRAGQRIDCSIVPYRGPVERRTPEDDFVKHIGGLNPRFVESGFELRHAARDFLSYLVVWKRGVQQQVRGDLQTKLRIPGKQRNHHAAGLVIAKGREVPAHRFNCFSNLLRRPRCGPAIEQR